MKRILIAFPVILITVFAGNSFAHGGHHSIVKDSTARTISPAAADTAMQRGMEEHRIMKAVDAFPNYHPLVVHFPIVLLLMAVFFQLLSFFIYKKEFSIATIILLSLGVLSTWLASNIFHAHPAELAGKANEIFETHEQMATLTWWFSLSALIAKIGSHFFLERKWWIESMTAVLLIVSAVGVSIAGHHGSMLVHMEGIGPMGNHLESANMPEMTSGKPSAPMPMKVPEPAKENISGSGQEENHHVDEFGKGPHGGTIKEADPYHIELKAEGTDLIFYLLDGDAKPIDMKNITGSFKIQNPDKSVKKIALMEMSGKLTAMQSNNGQTFTGICTLTKDGKSYTASFNSAKDLPAKK